MQPQRMSIKTPEILWSGGNDNGKPNPVFAVDILPLMCSCGAAILCTSGTDGSTPTKGSARVWKLLADKDTPAFLLDLNDHQSAVHSARFSPCGTMLATASDRMIIIYTVPSADAWEATTEEKDLQKTWLRPHLQEIYDLRWSPDSTHIIAGSIDCKAEILRIDSKGATDLPGHSSYVQGVAWDPLNRVVVTQSADRSCRTYQLRSMAAGGIKLRRGGVSAIKMSYAPPALLASTVPVDAGKSSDEATPAVVIKSSHLFADDTVASFFRRPDFCPDGSILVCPTGLYRPIPGSSGLSQSFCCHVFSRNQLTYPIASLAGLEDASIAVRFSPVVYRMLQHTNKAAAEGTETPPADEAKAPHKGYMQGDFRYVFAVATPSTVFVYDTQHSHPLVRITGCHLATINDVAWSVDGNILTCCSSDGYVTIIRFEPGSLGSGVDAAEIPNSIKFSHRCQYGITAEDISAAETADSKADGNDDKEDNDHDEKLEGETDAPKQAAVGVSESPRAVEMGSETESAKKRRRICPTPLGDVAPVVVGDAFRCEGTVGSAVAAQVLAPVASCNEPIAPPALALEQPVSTDQTSAPAKKVKKRIAPVLVSNATA